MQGLDIKAHHPWLNRANDPAASAYPTAVAIEQKLLLGQQPARFLNGATQDLDVGSRSPGCKPQSRLRLFALQERT